MRLYSDFNWVRRELYDSQGDYGPIYDGEEIDIVMHDRIQRWRIKMSEDEIYPDGTMIIRYIGAGSFPLDDEAEKMLQGVWE